MTIRPSTDRTYQELTDIANHLVEISEALRSTNAMRSRELDQIAHHVAALRGVSGGSQDRKDAERSATGETWLPMMSAPLDGTEIEILFQHFDYWTCLKLEGKERADKEYRAVQRAHWIDHNGGGWTWHGMAGSPVAWRPIRSSDSRSESGATSTSGSDNG